MTANAMDSHEFYAKCFFILLNVLINKIFLGASGDNKCEGYCIFLSIHTILEKRNIEYSSVSFFFFAGDPVYVVKGSC